MKILKELFKLIISLTIIFTLGAYGFFLYTFPIVASSVENVMKYEDFLSKKISAPVLFNEFEINTHPNLSFEIALKGIYVIPKGKNNLFHADNLKYSASIFDLKHGKLSADYIYADIDGLKDSIKLENKPSKKPFNINFFPKTDIKKAYIKLDESNYTEIDYIKSEKEHGKIITKLLAKLYNPYTVSPIIFGQNGSINYKNKISFDNFSVNIENSELYFSGDNSGMSIKGKNLPVAELESKFLYFYKLRNPQKRNFIENFSNFKGLIDVDLLLYNKGITGKCVTRNLGADFSNFKIPVFFPETVFEFNEREVNAETRGTFGGENVKTDFHLTGIFTKDLLVFGSVSGALSDKFAKKYYPLVGISGVADAEVNYTTQNEKSDVYYTLKINKGSNLLSKWGNLDNTDKNRKIFMHTVKQGNPMKIEEWNYTVNDSDKIVYGSGNFDKINGRYNLSALNIKTNGRTSVDYIKSFLRDYISDGAFEANLNIDFLKNTLLGTLDIYDISHKDFLFLKNTKLVIEKNIIKFLTEGTFYSSPIKVSANVENRFSEDILIHDINISLDEFFLKNDKFASIPKSFKKNVLPQAGGNKKKITYTVEKGQITANRIYGDKFDVRNVNIQGSLKDEIVVFVIPKADYANGLLSAKGLYNLSNHASNIHFYASDIDSNIVLTDFFKLPNQVCGDAFATLHVLTRNKLSDVKAYATFAISDGFMPEIADQEFYIGRKKKDGTKKRKYTLSKIINIDFSNQKELNTNIYGSFTLDNDIVRNLKMFTKSEWLGLYFEGNYDIYTKAVNLNIYGRRNKTHGKGIKIFKIPLNLLYKIAFKAEHSADQYQDKIKLIPEIKSNISDQIAIFRVSVLGFFGRKNGIKFEMKDLR